MGCSRAAWFKLREALGRQAPHGCASPAGPLVLRPRADVAGTCPPSPDPPSLPRSEHDLGEDIYDCVPCEHEGDDIYEDIIKVEVQQPMVSRPSRAAQPSTFSQSSEPPGRGAQQGRGSPRGCTPVLPGPPGFLPFLGPSPPSRTF